MSLMEHILALINAPITCYCNNEQVLSFYSNVNFFPSLLFITRIFSKACISLQSFCIAAFTIELECEL